MRTIRWSVEMTLNGCDVSDTFEVEDNATEEEIDALVREEVFNCVTWGWSEEGKG